MLKMDVSLKEAALIRHIRDTHKFVKVVVHKLNGEIERISDEELYTIKDLIQLYGLAIPLDKAEESNL